MAAVTERFVGSCYAGCAVNRIVVFAWTGDPTMEGAIAMTSMFDRVHARESGQLGMLIIIAQKASRSMPAPVREHLTHAMAVYGLRIRAVAYVVEGTGFEGTIVRSIITAMNMVSRPAYWVSVFADRSRAVAALLAQMSEGTSATSKDLLAALDDLLRST